MIETRGRKRKRRSPPPKFSSSSESEKEPEQVRAKKTQINDKENFQKKKSQPGIYLLEQQSDVQTQENYDDARPGTSQQYDAEHYSPHEPWDYYYYYPHDDYNGYGHDYWNYHNSEQDIPYFDDGDVRKDNNENVISPIPPERPDTPAGIEKNPYGPSLTIENTNFEKHIDSSPPQDMMEKIFYPPESAIPDLLPDTDEVRFIYKNKHYGRFKLIGDAGGDPLAFKVSSKLILAHATPFLADCYDDPKTRPESSRTSDDLRYGQSILTQASKETLGFSVNLSPPSFIMHKVHPIHNELRRALNKHRDERSSKEDVQKALRGIDTFHTLKRLKNQKDRPLPTKVSDFMTVTTAGGCDDIITFLNTPTAATFNFLADITTAFTYLSVPSLESLALQHQLKEELLLHLGFYNHSAAIYNHLSTIKSATPSGSPLVEKLEQGMRWNAYGYKSMAKMAIRIAEKLGAASLLLRMEATAQQTAPETADLLVYNQDIVSTTIFKLSGQQFFDAAVANKTLKPVKRFSQGNTSTQSQRNNNRGNQFNQESSPFKRPYSQENPTRFPRLPFRGQRFRFPPPQRGGRGGNTRFTTRNYQPTNRNFPRQRLEHQGHTNADSRTKTFPKPPSYKPKNK